MFWHGLNDRISFRSLVRVAWTWFRGESKPPRRVRHALDRVFRGMVYGVRPGDPPRSPGQSTISGRFMVIPITSVEPGKEVVVELKPKYPFRPHAVKLGDCPGLDVTEFTVADQTIWSEPVPAELLHEVSDVPELSCPTCLPGESIVLKVRVAQ